MHGGFPNYCASSSCSSAEEPKVRQERELAKTSGSGGSYSRTVRFRVASANSGRVLTEVFKEETASWWGCGSSVCGDSVDSDCSSLPEVVEGRRGDASTGGGGAGDTANRHLHGLAGATLGESGCDSPDDHDPLLLYASAKRELRFSNKRVNICSKNGTIRGVRNKVSAGQVLFNNLSNLPNVYAVNLRNSKNHQKKRPWE